MKVKVLFLGDNENAHYHPLAKIESGVEGILKQYTEMTLSDDSSILRTDLSQYDVIMIYSDRWDSVLEDPETENLVGAIREGGRLVVIHSGISLANRAEVAGMVGASFGGHPPATVLSYDTVGEHPICTDIKSFEMFEEPYQYNFLEDSEIDVFLTFSYNEDNYPAGWTTKFGAGKIVSLQPGHDQTAFKHPTYQQMILNSLKWCMTS